MPASLIVNADDFGLTAGINRCIGELYRGGVLTSATLMANGPAFEDAVAVARRNPGLGVGCHVVLVDGEPVLPGASVRSLLGPDGSFRSSLNAFAATALLGRLREGEVRDEALAQIRKIEAAGVPVTHVDTHKHTHVFPAVSRGLLAAARLAGVRAVRNPFEPEWSVRFGGTFLRRLEVRVLRQLQRRFLANPALRDGMVGTTDGTIGIAATGHLDAAALRSLLGGLPDGRWELVCHPGYDDADLGQVRTRLRSQREIERRALLDLIPERMTERGAPVLTHYGELQSRSLAMPLRG